MKKLIMLVISSLAISLSHGQTITDALRYSNDDIKGTARFRALSGAFGALGGDISAISINPASSAVFTSSHATFTLENENLNNETSYFNGRNSSSDSNLDLTQGGGVFVFKNQNLDSPWKKFAVSIAFENSKNYDNNWRANGTSQNSIDGYFLANAQGLPLSDISALTGESTTDAYSEIGSIYGYQNQQAFLGYDSYILEPETFDDTNTVYFSNIAPGNFNQAYTYSATGYNGKLSFNAGAQYTDDLYIGLNLNSHFLNYERYTSFYETNNNENTLVDEVLFDNTLTSNGTGFSFQLGTIYKITPELRIGITYDSPTWMTIEEETTQYLETHVLDDVNGDFYQIVDPNIVNVFAGYKLQTPAKFSSSIAYVFGDKGLISFDYSTKDYSKTKFKPTSDAYYSEQNNIMSNALTNASTYRIGAEYKVKKLSFRGGYRFEESPYKNGKTIGDLTGYSLGLGYDFGNTVLDLTYSNAKQSRDNQFFDVGFTNAATVDNTNSNITLSLGFKL